jgi:predicted lipid-binding transport protein (Tim44 family)
VVCFTKLEFYMKFMSRLSVVLVSLALILFSINADAANKRMGGGKSVGQQSQNVTNKQAMPPAGAPAAAPGAAAAKPAAPAAAPAPAAPKPWGAMLGGLAAGLGLAWLANSMGLGGAMGNILTALLIGFAVFMVIGFIMRRRAQSQNPQGLQPAYTNKDYNPDNVGNDAAARPFERTAYKYEPAANQGQTMIGSGIANGVGATSSLSGSQAWGVPADFDTAGFLSASKHHFVSLQAAWDKGDIDTLRSMMTEEMVTEVRNQIYERQATSPAGTVFHTEVVTVEAQLLGIEELQTTRHYMASVEFAGAIREEAGVAPVPFREVWNLTKPVTGGGWLVAGIQAVNEA